MILDQYRHAPPVWPTPDGLVNFEASEGCVITGQAATNLGAARSNAQAKFGGWSLSVPVYANNITLATTLGGGLFPVPGNTEDFTMGGWYRPTATGKDEQIFGYGDSWTTFGFYHNALGSNAFTFKYLNAPTGFVTVGLGGLTQFALNTWHYLEASRVGNTIYIFVNGSLRATSVISGGSIPFTSSGRGSVFTIGMGAGGGSANGQFFVDEVAIHKGVGLHTSGFLPRTTAYV